MSREHLSGLFQIESEEKEMSLSLINCLLFIKGVSCSRLTMNAITHFHLRIYPLVQINLFERIPD